MSEYWIKVELIRINSMSAENDIRKASDKFYAALNSTLNGDCTPMADVWSRNPEVSAMHPIGGTEIGWGEIRASWENLAKICSNGTVELRDQRIFLEWSESGFSPNFAYAEANGRCSRV
jgi:hypothetical protein